MGISVDRKMEQQPTNPKFEGTDLNLSLTTGTGVSKKDAIHEVERSFNVISLCSEEAKRIEGESGKRP